ncbi:hypothetical protein EMIHUDRAFT_216305 [Emiliania huxleyi CCMP1516]|uniref:Uncharacterized protein n=2 Tax=Emiliania huxleyi TaxID=2903 RepID=A0A0D3IER4_EMIH1|nr:hypothetical protein EMIHUDRAFT_216305 [Emiliania huxleyi CCMP1516]EOD09749.1 hypothetical protein EMIHUDRAFT_216305 [Emiliania huxleyi CCMP1516]|eukprot:XP_005762178.1 hypothetical protein EMIHUDRAFT_216305 [Emiliania huxleyi CCMP1516]
MSSGELLHQYEALACTSGVAYTFGDFVSQIYQGRTLASLDLPRSFRSGAAGFIGHGPLRRTRLSRRRAFGVDPSLEVELSRQQLLDNCWPLLAFWPVLFAFHQGARPP